MAKSEEAKERVIKLYNGDVLEELAKIPSGSVDLVITDPPYNIGVKTVKNGKATKNEWDVVDNYIPWCVDWLTECCRVLKPYGVLYFWQNDIEQIAEMLHAIKEQVPLIFRSFCIWDKGETFRALSWKNRRTDSANSLRSWFNRCEYCLHFFRADKPVREKTGLERINENPLCYKSLKQWFASEKERLRLTDADILECYKRKTGKSGAMLRHYFKDSQFEIPTEDVWKTVFRPLGFERKYEELRAEYEGLRAEYEGLRAEYEGLRGEGLKAVHNVDAEHSNVWRRAPLNSYGRIHTCEKPVDLQRRMIRVSSRPGGVVLDCFMGSGSAGEAALLEGRSFIGIERDFHYFQHAKKRIEGVVVNEKMPL